MMFIELNIKSAKNIKGKRAKKHQKNRFGTDEKKIGEPLKKKKEVLRAV